MNLKHWIDDNELTQAEAARLLGEHQSTVSRWTSGARKVPPEKVLHVERVTGVPRHELRPDIYPRDRAA